MSNKHYILDPLWITRKDYVDSEYFKYVLLAARKKYLASEGNVNNENFYEVLFHYLNINNLVLDGNLFDFKMNSFWKSEKIRKISRELYTFYKSHNETGETVKMANQIFKDLSLKYLGAEAEVFNSKDASLYYVNKKIHLENKAFILINNKSSDIYDIWKLHMDRRCRTGYRFTKYESLKIKELKKDSLKMKIDALNNDEFNSMDPDVNLLFCIIKKEKHDLDEIANAVKNSILLNKLMANDVRFDPNIIQNAYNLLLYENVLPFKLDESFL